MLYKLTTTQGKLDKIAPVPFKNLAELQQREKDLEELIAQNLFDVLFESNRLMPVFQERSYQSESDIYALNEEGDLYIFELKRAVADGWAVHQLLGYAQDAGQWSYAQLQAKFQQYSVTESKLSDAHREAFGLEQPLDMRQFNSRQRLVVIGNSANESLINAVNYWCRQGVHISFLPYRIYELGGEQYFELFSIPYDQHLNPADRKGVIFDTCLKYWPKGIWYMIENRRVAAFGDATRYLEYVSRHDFIFFYHKGFGVVAAATITGGVLEDSENTVDGYPIKYRDVEFKTPVHLPTCDSELRAMPAGTVQEIMDQNYYWATTLKVPYLSLQKAEILVEKLSRFQNVG